MTALRFPAEFAVGATSPEPWTGAGPVDCGACEPVCPVQAISFEADTPAEWRVFASVNAEFFEDLGSPGGARAVGKVRKDHPIVAGLPPQR